MDNPQENQKTELSPAWKQCLKEMREEGIPHGKTYPTTYFETKFHCHRASKEFNNQMGKLRAALKKEFLGQQYYISEHSRDGVFTVLDGSDTSNRIVSREENALKVLNQEAVQMRISLLNNPTANLAQEERKHIESMLEKASTRLALISLSKAKTISNTPPQLLDKEKAA